MNGETEIIKKEESTNGVSHFFGVSIRGWLALILIVTVCAMAILAREVKEPLYSLSIGALGFYFGQNTKGASK